MKRNYLKIGDKVKLKNGSIVTVKALEYDCFSTDELNVFVSKKDIIDII